MVVYSEFGNWLGSAGWRWDPAQSWTEIEAHFPGSAGHGKTLGQIAANPPTSRSQGFDADHRDIELLKLRNFTIGKKIPDSVFTADDSQDKITDIIRAMVGYVSGTCSSGSM